MKVGHFQISKLIFASKSWMASVFQQDRYKNCFTLQARDWSHPLNNEVCLICIKFWSFTFWIRLSVAKEPKTTFLRMGACTSCLKLMGANLHPMHLYWRRPCKCKFILLKPIFLFEYWIRRTTFTISIYICHHSH